MKRMFAVVLAVLLTAFLVSPMQAQKAGIAVSVGTLGPGESCITFMLDMGVIYTGSPEIDLNATGMLSPTAREEQEAALNEGLESLVLYPVFSFGIGIRI